jgi:hypothetical protein
MKKVLLLASVAAMLTVAPVRTADAKPLYCLDALEQCVGGCWFIPPACWAGCAIGYAFCGE